MIRCGIAGEGNRFSFSNMGCYTKVVKNLGLGSGIGSDAMVPNTLSFLYCRCVDTKSYIGLAFVGAHEAVS